ncbi:hypothetical protein [Sideroxydans lithotrophicus]|uniref:Lipoprotein n=1 Tax=Sideroxydans lithotrophicus (strain ES-1) TaxID=580332 RepID=D5CR64_SIDLE|nr:hypothetical protein [Sideroxydans lithotrophicus]ADE11450.1 hypothetical protein Slit_1212 [Sideroxydans lithotrophicus ES-1]
MIRKISVLVVYVAVLSIFAGCGSTKPKAESWVLPKKEKADSAMLIGYIGYPNNKKENPENNKLYLSEVNFMTKDKAVYFGNGEPNIELDNNYFVVPNLKPGKYYLVSFRTGELFDQLPLYDEKYVIEVKPGQIKFFGSFDFLEYDSSFLGAHSYKFSIRKTEKPSELEMFQWLNRVGAGSGWEPAIKKRIHELGAQP